MILRNLITTDGRSVDLYFQGELTAGGDEFELAFDRAPVFPGLINSHDHLDFNLFPQLGNGGFNNYTEWGHYLHAQFRKEIDAVLKVPAHLRAAWGIYKNLLCGVTTVVNHGAWLPVTHPLIRVYQDCQSLHSVQFEKYWKLRLNNPFRRNDTCVIHCAEGTDELAAGEPTLIKRWNFLERDIVAVHGINMSSDQSVNFQALVWCPLSNDFLYHRTASVEELQTRILFGTDSTLTGSWNMWDHIYHAKHHCGQSDDVLLPMLTTTAGEVWGFQSYGKGNIPSDLFVVRQKEGMSFSDIRPADILLVTTRGRIRLIDASFTPQLRAGGKTLPGFCQIDVQGSTKLVEGNLPGLMDQIRSYAPGITFPVTEKKACQL